MKRILLLILAVATFSHSRVSAQKVFGDAPVRFVLPARFEPERCHFTTMLSGPFGRVGGWIRPKPNSAEFEVATVYKVIPAESLRVALYCSVDHVQTETFTSLSDLAGRTIELNPKPLGTVRFLGVVRGLASPKAQGRSVDVGYLPWWICEFLEIIECGLGGVQIASVKLDRNGRFSVSLPDVLRDPTIKSSRKPGEFTFGIRKKDTGNPPFELRAAGSGHPVGYVRAASHYPGTQVFDAVAK